MTSFLDQPQLRYLGTGIFMLGSAFAILRWVQRTLREQVGALAVKRDDAAAITRVESVPQALVKKALDRGLVTASQLAAMAPRERLFLFASLGERLNAQSPQPASGSPTSAQLAPPRAASRGIAHGPSAINAGEFGLASMPVNERLHVHCAICGEALVFPAFAPYVAHCAQCGTRTAVREDVAGHYLLNVTPAQKPEIPRGPSLV